MAEAGNCRGECGGGLLVDITARETDRRVEREIESECVCVCGGGVQRELRLSDHHRSARLN